MKKLMLLAAVAVFGLTNVTAQEGFSAKAGFNSVSFEFAGVSVSESGFYIGAGYQFEVSEDFDVEPAVLYSSVSDLSSLYVPVMAKYNVSEDFSIQAGPQVNYILEDGFDDGAFGLDLAFGLGYNITEEFYAEGRYGLGVVRDLDDVDVNTITIGVGYRF
ncbi:outer membrane beta-barrel protein [Psychroserpens sp. MEBiC05023]